MAKEMSIFTKNKLKIGIVVLVVILVVAVMASIIIYNTSKEKIGSMIYVGEETTTAVLSSRLLSKEDKEKYMRAIEGGNISVEEGWNVRSIVSSEDTRRLQEMVSDSLRNEFGLYVEKGWKYQDEYITGTVKNETDKNYKSVSVTFGVYDKAGDKIGTAFDHMSGLESGESWSFKAYVSEKEAQTVKFQEIDSF